MQTLVNMKPITTLIRPSLCYGDLHSHNIQDFWTLLLYTGYLTFNPKSINENTNGDTVCDLYIPNNEITGCFRSKILNYYKNNPEIQNSTRELAKALFNGDGEEVEKNINNLLSKYISIKDLSTKAPKENYYHGFLNGVLINSASVIKEHESNIESGNGFIDILLKSRINKSIAILELKQTPNELEDRVALSKKAIQQIIHQKYAQQFMSNAMIENIYAYGISFYKKECTVVVEKLK